jgi:hypothetical protein
VLTGEKKSKGKQDEPSSEFDNFQRLLKNVLSSPKEELDKRQDEYKRQREKKK